MTSSGRPKFSFFPSINNRSCPGNANRHVDAVELCFYSFLEDIEKTRPRYAGEE